MAQNRLQRSEEGHISCFYNLDVVGQVPYASVAQCNGIQIELQARYEHMRSNCMPFNQVTYENDIHSELFFLIQIKMKTLPEFVPQDDQIYRVKQLDLTLSWVDYFDIHQAKSTGQIRDQETEELVSALVDGNLTIPERKRKI